MFYSIVLIISIVFAFYFCKRWKALPENQRKDFVRKVAIWGGLGIVLALVVTGRTSWIMGALAAVIAIMARVSQLVVYFPILKKIFPSIDKNTKSGPSDESSAMTKEHAAEILGIELDATVEEIRMAHKRLMQKLHPDRGGSAALAKQINQAKDVLTS